ncbi:hypothetical protein NMO_1074 [Neisseria meningitidis alpha14]|uniref:Uncharacterized protein n=1 Tax=Neisseria meningitidis (strain alpha14) TaxID=662598 RepID=C6S779_NEIML|nr:hypothetical protein NMO_1074 [Neisseria meningitidis alpha14]
MCGLLEEGAHGKSPKCHGGNLGDFGEFCKGLKPYFPAKKNKKICNTFTHKQAVEDFSVVIGYDEIKAKNYRAVFCVMLFDRLHLRPLADLQAACKLGNSGFQVV